MATASASTMMLLESGLDTYTDALESYLKHEFFEEMEGTVLNVMLTEALFVIKSVAKTRIQQKRKEAKTPPPTAYSSDESTSSSCSSEASGKSCGSVGSFHSSKSIPTDTSEEDEDDSIRSSLHVPDVPYSGIYREPYKTLAIRRMVQVVKGALKLPEVNNEMRTTSAINKLDVPFEERYLFFQ